MSRLGQVWVFRYFQRYGVLQTIGNIQTLAKILLGYRGAIHSGHICGGRSFVLPKGEKRSGAFSKLDGHMFHHEGYFFLILF